MNVIKENWSSKIPIFQIINILLELLRDPNPESPLNLNAGKIKSIFLEIK